MTAAPERSRDWIALSLLGLVIVFAIFSLITATIGAGLAVIPLLDLLAMLLVPFPSLLLYAGATTVLYLIAKAATLRWYSDRSWLPTLLLFASLAAPLAAGWAFADSANRRAGVASETASPGWSPVRLAPGGQVALVGDRVATPAACDGFCLSLLVTGQAKQVIVATLPSGIGRGARLAGTAFALKADWRRCAATLPDSLSIWRGGGPGERRRHLIDFGLDPYFSNELPRCLDARLVQFAAGALPTLIAWQHEGTQKRDQDAPVGWQAPYAEQWVLAPGGGDANRRPIRFGYRYAVPAMIWPYGGNAGFGGRFSPTMAKVMLSTPSRSGLDGPAWWDMVDDGVGLATRAIAILDASTTDRVCIPQPGPCVFR